MKHVLVNGSFCIALLWSASGEAGNIDRRTTWRKPGVSFQDYIADARACGTRGGMADVRSSANGRTALTALETSDRLVNMAIAEGEKAIRNALRYNRQVIDPERQIDHVQEERVSDVEKCLMDRGYAEIRLSNAEQRTLRTLKIGSGERRRYLHAIASR